MDMIREFLDDDVGHTDGAMLGVENNDRDLAENRSAALATIFQHISILLKADGGRARVGAGGLDEELIAMTNRGSIFQIRLVHNEVSTIIVEFRKELHTDNVLTRALEEFEIVGVVHEPGEVRVFVVNGEHEAPPDDSGLSQGIYPRGEQELVCDGLESYRARS